MGLALLFSLGACAKHLSDSGRKVRTARSASEVSACEFVGSVQGTTNYNDAVSDLSQTYARNDALNEAGDLGATHVVWLSLGSHSADAEAYRCLR